MARTTHIAIIAIAFFSNLFGMEEKKTTASNTQLTQRNTQTNTAQNSHQQLAQAPSITTQTQNNNIALTKTGKCTYCLLCLGACKLAYTAYANGQKHRTNY